MVQFILYMWKPMIGKVKWFPNVPQIPRYRWKINMGPDFKSHGLSAEPFWSYKCTFEDLCHLPCVRWWIVNHLVRSPYFSALISWNGRFHLFRASFFVSLYHIPEYWLHCPFYHYFLQSSLKLGSPQVFPGFCAYSPSYISSDILHSQIALTVLESVLPLLAVIPHIQSACLNWVLRSFFLLLSFIS